MLVSDSGPHFRSRRAVSFACNNLINEMRKENDSIDKADPKDKGRNIVEQVWGCPQHGKSAVDRAFALANQRIREVAKGRPLLTCGDVVRELQEAAQVTAEVRCHAKEFFIDLLPAVPKDL